MLIARIYEVFPLVCPMCAGQMRIIAFITHSADIRRILDHIGVESQPPPIAPARGPPLWDDWGDAHSAEGGRSRTRLGLGSATGPRLWGGPARQLVRDRSSDFTALRGSPASATVQKPAHTQRLLYLEHWTAQTTEIKGAWMPQTRAILGPMWLNFLSI